MLKRILLATLSLLGIFVVTGIILLSGSQLVTTINFLLPQDWTIRTAQGARTNWQGIQLAQFSLDYQQCPLLISQNLSVQWVRQNRIILDTPTIDYHCLDKLFHHTETVKTDHGSFSLQKIFTFIPYGELLINELNWINLPPDLSPRLKTLLATPSRSQIRYASEHLAIQINQTMLQFSAELAKKKLKVQLDYHPENEQHQVLFTTPVTEDLSQIPNALKVDYQWQVPVELWGEDFSQGEMSLSGQQQAGQIQGNIVYQSRLNPRNILMLPFSFAENTLSIEQGKFSWDWLPSFPLNGFINAKLTPRDVDFANFFPLKSYFRISLLSQGQRGKGNIVIENREGEWLADSLKLPLRLTGEIKYQDFILYSAIPLELQGGYRDLSLHFLPTSLLRLAGKQQYLTIHDLRFPLAGIHINKTGVNGRLEALFKGESPDFKQINLHLDGFAHHFKAGQSNFFDDPKDKKMVSDQWNWRVWGNTIVNSLNAKIDMQGYGNWHKNLVQLYEFKGNLARVVGNHFVLEPMELKLNEPIKLAYEKYQLDGALILKSPRVTFDYGGELSHLQATLKMSGVTDNLSLRGEIKTSHIGPLRLFARRHLSEQASHFNGRIYWNEQPLSVFQSLIPFWEKIVIKNGRIKGETAFSYDLSQGFIAGGHFSVKEGSVSLPNGEMNGAEFSLPYQLKQGELDFGVKKPIELTIKFMDISVPMSNVHVKVNGHYPFSQQKPLYLSQLSLNLLGGRLSVDRFALPQTHIAYLNLQDIELSKVFSAMQYNQIELVSRVNANLPFWLAGKPCFVCNGTIEQTTSSTLTFSPEMQAAIRKGGYTEKILFALMNGSQLKQLKADMSVAENGKMQLKAQIQTELEDKHHAQIHLNYTHQENLFDLWKTIYYGSQFEQNMEYHLYQKLDRKP